MAEPFDTLAAAVADIITRLADGEITEAQAAAQLSPLLAGVNDGEFAARVEEIVGVIGRVTGLLFVEVPAGQDRPSNLIGAPDAYAWDRERKTFWGPKDKVTGWPEGDVMTEGPPGPTGPKGDTGDTGAVGPKGDTGDTGPKGDAGDAGPKGDQGDTGPKGDTGDQGIQGDAGPKGDTGDVGPKGDPGDTGATGAKGDKGDRGDAFTVNAQGNLAGRAAYDAEAVGFSYLDVENGNLYFRIAAGGWSTPIPFGKGDKGDDGDPGASAYGVAVANGFVGTEAAWLASLVGAKGDDGDQGPPGADGADGADGSDATVTEAAISTALGFTPADQASVPVNATGAELRTGTNDDKFLTAKAVTDAAAIAALTLATPDLSIPNQTITLSANSTLGAPTNAVEGKSGTILIKQDATGSRTLAYNAAWKPFGSVPALSTAANAVDLLTWFAESSAKVRFTLQKGGAA